VASVIAGVAKGSEARDLIARAAVDIGEDLWAALRDDG
jgi:hypothetical protein